MITEKQKLERKNSIGGSDVAPLLGLSPWKTPLDVYLDKTGQAPEIDEDKLPLRLFMGNRLEPVVAELFAHETGLPVNIYPETIKNRDFPNSHVNLDGVIWKDQDIKVEDAPVAPILDAVVEFKTSENKSLWEGDETPTLYKPQLMHARILTGVRRVYLAVLIGFNEFKYYTYEPTEQEIENEVALQNYIKMFWENHVEPKIPPTPRFYEDAAKLYPQSKLDTIKTTNDTNIINAHAKLNSIKTEIKECKEKESSLKAIIGDYLKDDSELRDEAGKRMVTWKTQEATRFNTTEFKKYHPEVYKEYGVTNSSRVMRVY